MTVDTIVNFSMFGIASNFVFILLSTVVSSVKIKQMSSSQLMETVMFSEVRSRHILETTTGLRRLLHFMLVFVPTYSVYINVVFLYHLFSTNDSNPVVKACMMADNASIVPLATFKKV